MGEGTDYQRLKRQVQITGIDSMISLRRVVLFIGPGKCERQFPVGAYYRVKPGILAAVKCFITKTLKPVYFAPLIRMSLASLFVRLKRLFLVISLLLCFTEMYAQQADSGMVLHTVMPGENLYRISLKYNVTVPQLMEWNSMDNPDVLKAGQVLRLWPSRKEVSTAVTVPNLKPGEQAKDSLVKSPPQEPLRDNFTAGDTVKTMLPGGKQKKGFFPGDSLKKKNEESQTITFSGTRMAPKEEEFDTTGRLDITGYVSVYYAHYTDSVGNEQYQKFPTLCPLGDEVGLNLIQVSARYTAKTIRGVVTLHWGDMPASSWSPKYNIIQQANLGIRIVPKLWFDVGYFRTHIGLESVQPRENINSTMAVTTFFEPYYLAGAKLTWQATSKFALQVNSFNQFNGFTENNRRKAVGLSATWDISPKLSLVANTIYTDDAPDNAPRRQARIYNDFYLVYKSKRIVLGYELNFGAQQNSGLKDSTATATMVSSLLAVKYKLNKRLGLYTRLEYFKDDNGMMGDIYKNAVGNSLGLNMSGIDLGVEIKPVSNSYVRFEYRHLRENVPEGSIFYYNGSFRSYRHEYVFSTGFWF